jgi:hypothetical protein
MENMEKKEGVCEVGKGGCCSSMGHMHCHCGRHHLVKIILKLFIVIIIFWCGFQLGAMTGLIRAERGSGNNFRTMRGYNYSGNTQVNPVTPGVGITTPPVTQ